jgi:hypothetical protein
MPGANSRLLQLEPEDKLVLDPAGGPDDKPQASLRLTSQSEVHVAFKVKTTAPKAYLVRPSSGTLDPKGSQEVQIILHSQSPLDAATVSTHKFLVQAMVAPSGTPDWKSADNPIYEQKVAVALGQPEPVAATPETQAKTKVLSSGQRYESYDQLKVMYDELVSEVLAMEKKKGQLEDEKKLLSSQREAGKAADDRSGWLRFSVAFLIPLILAVAVAHLKSSGVV